MSEIQDLLEAEELDVLIERGTEFTVTKRSLLRFFGPKQRTFQLRQPYLGTLNLMAHQSIRMPFDQSTLENQPFEQSRRIVQQNAHRSARIVAIAILNSHWQISLFSGLLARYLLWHLTPEQLFMLTITVNKVSNIGDFINSIRLMSASPRTTAPALMEKIPEENLQD